MGTRLVGVVCVLTLAGLIAACGDNLPYEPDAADCTPVDDGNECTDDLCTEDGQPQNLPKNEGTACGAGVCDADGDCVECVEDNDCTSPEVCDEASNACVAVTCTDGEQNGDETDVDCGGSCAPGRRCGDTLGCGVPGDCQSGVCTGDVCQAPACGDGVRQGSEACDDGNHTNGDGCDDGTGGSCRPTGCGNGTVSGTEVCDDGNTTNGDGCDNNCTTTACGNGVIAGSETCDDSDAMAGDGCSATCTIEPGYTCTMVPSVCVATCGNGIVTPGEACDDAPPAENGDGCSMTCTLEPGFTCTGSPSVCTTTCGDGVRAPGEGCDDGDTMPGDGCNATCFVEPGWVCAGMPSACFPICGDGRVVPTEGCDDPAPAENGDGCSSTCTVEPGYMCAGSPSLCLGVCGDGLVMPGEACDDPAPAESGDGCSLTCTVESGWTCSGAPSTCVTTCGDAIPAGTEQCDDPSPAEAGDGCSATCTIEPGYTCNGIPSACATVCGDGMVVGSEPCDDPAPVEDGDGCSATCTVEPGYNCQGSPSTCALTCGNGVVDLGEGCDDSGLVNNDGCSAACTVESGFTCVGAPSVCTTTCGDGIPAGLEQCDDAPPAESNDGCSAACTLETGFTCTGTPSVCVTTCGDGITGGAETCDDGCAAGTPGLCEPVDDNDGCSSTCVIECGNGVFNPALEQCDDGNRTAGDGCSSTCTFEVTCGAGETLVQVRSTDVPEGIPDNVPAGVDSDAVIAASHVGAVRTVHVGLGRVTHSFPGNVVLSLVSPSLRSRNLWSRRGGTGDNWITTRFDDAAATPVSAVVAANAPYTAAYRPEQTLSDGPGFRDQNPAGTWRLHAADLAANDAGVIEGWTLSICYLPGAPHCGDGVISAFEECDDGNLVDTDACSNACGITDGCGDGNLDAGEQCDDDGVAAGDGCSATCQVDIGCAPAEVPVIVTNSSPFLVPDNNPAGVTSPVDVPVTGAVTKMSVFIGNLTHTFDADVDLFLISPRAVRRELSTDNGSTGDNYVGTYLEDSAATAVTSGVAPFTGHFRPEQTLTSSPNVDFLAASAAGTWSLLAIDDLGSDTGTLNSWTLAMCVNPTGPFCGDGITSVVEECDDGNTTDNDVCNNRCGITDGCGDGNLDAGEQCDDDNQISGDGCSSTCISDISCGPGETVFLASNPTVVSMPDNDRTGVVSSITVPTAGVVRKVIPTLSITHTDDADVDIFLTPPFGLQRDLSSDQGGVNYAATMFVDTAVTPITAGTAPYTGAFVPEQSISNAAGFANQSAQGEWLLRVADDLATDTGMLTSWTLAVCIDTSVTSVCGNGIVEASESCDDTNAIAGDGCAPTCQLELGCAVGQTPLVVRSADLPDTIPDLLPAGAVSTVNVANAGIVRKAVVVLGSISHQNDAHLDIALVSPAATTIDLSSDNGGTGDDYASTILDDGAGAVVTSGTSPFRGRFRPEVALSGVNGQPAQGVWSLRVADDTGADGGVFTSWVLGLCVE